MIRGVLLGKPPNCSKNTNFHGAATAEPNQKWTSINKQFALLVYAALCTDKATKDKKLMKMLKTWTVNSAERVEGE